MPHAQSWLIFLSSAVRVAHSFEALGGHEVLAAHGSAAQSSDACLRKAAELFSSTPDLEAYYQSIARRLMDVEACKFAVSECDLDEQAWPLPCVYRWDRPDDEKPLGRTPHFVGSFKPGEMLYYASNDLFVGRFGEISEAGTANADVVEANSILLAIDGKPIENGTYHIGYVTLELDGTGLQSLALTVSVRLYFPPGFHHCVVLATNRVSTRDRPGHVRFLSFWFEMEPNEVSQLEFDARDVPVESRGRYDGGSSLHYHRDYTFVTCCGPFGNLFYHTTPHRARMVTGTMVGEKHQPLWAGESVINKLPIVDWYSYYSESQCEHVWADVIIFAEGWPGFVSQCSHYWMEFLSNLFSLSRRAFKLISVMSQPTPVTIALNRSRSL